jgi:hypothetical protein
MSSRNLIDDVRTERVALTPLTGHGPRGDRFVAGEGPPGCSVDRRLGDRDHHPGLTAQWFTTLAAAPFAADNGRVGGRVHARPPSAGGSRWPTAARCIAGGSPSQRVVGRDLAMEERSATEVALRAASQRSGGESTLPQWSTRPWTPPEEVDAVELRTTATRLAEDGRTQPWGCSRWSRRVGAARALRRSHPARDRPGSPNRLLRPLHDAAIAGARRAQDLRQRLDAAGAAPQGPREAADDLGRGVGDDGRPRLRALDVAVAQLRAGLPAPPREAGQAVHRRATLAEPPARWGARAVYRNANDLARISALSKRAPEESP